MLITKKLSFPDVFHKNESLYNYPCGDPFLMYPSLLQIP